MPTGVWRPVPQTVSNVRLPPILRAWSVDRGVQKGPGETGTFRELEKCLAQIMGDKGLTHPALLPQVQSNPMPLCAASHC